MTPHRLLHILTILLALLTATGCRDRRTAELLARADSVMEADPDSARALLDSIDPSRLRGSDLALYAVLDAQSRHKLNLGAPSDSLLNIAVDRYTAHGPDSLLMKALFYRAVNYQQEGNIMSAAADATGSWEIAEEVGNHYWIAKTAELVADLADNIMNYHETLKWRGLAAEHYRLAQRNYNHLTALCDVASAHLNLHHAEQALALDDSISKEISAFPEDTELQLYHAFTSLYIQNHYGSMDRADTLYRFLLKHDTTIDEYPSVKLIKANILLRSGQHEESLTLLESLDSILNSLQEQSMLHAMYYELAKKTGNLNLLQRMGDSLLSAQNKLISQALAQPVTTSQRDYFHTRSHFL